MGLDIKKVLGALSGGTMDFSNVSGEDLLKQGLFAAAANELSDVTEVQRPTIGYQGKIEPRKAVRQQIATPAPDPKGTLTLDTGRKNPETGEPIMQGIADPSVRGAKGKSYFTDVKYAKPDASRKTIPTEEEAREANRKEAEAVFAAQNPEAENPYTLPPAQDENNMAMGGRVPRYAQGGIAGAHKGYYLGGKTDGMADNVPARINGRQEARLSDGEFVVPADVVSHLGNGNSDAGAEQLHGMMDNVRTARTGTTEQGKQIDPQKFMPKMAQGGLARFASGGRIQKFNNGTPGTTVTEDIPDDNIADVQVDDAANLNLGSESSLSSWAGDYVTDMLSTGQALGEMGYNESGYGYTGDLTAGTSALQDTALTGISALNNPLSASSVTNQMGNFQPTQANLDPYMNPYQQQVIDRTAADMTRQDQINQLQQRQQLTSAGAFGGSRDALLRAESAGNLSRNIGDMAAEQRALNYTQAMDRATAAQEAANTYGFDVLSAQGAAGQIQRDIASEGIAADYAQFREQRDFPYKQVQFMQSLLQDMPLEAQTTTYSEASQLDKWLDSKEGLEYLMQLAGGTEPVPDQELNYDINNDGVVDEYDVGPAQPV